MLAIITLTIISIFILFLGFSKNRGMILPLGFLALAVALWSIASGNTFWNEYLTNMISFEGNSKYFSILLIIIALAIFPFFHELIKRGNEELADFIGIILLSIVGGLLMVSYQHMMTLFLGIEILSIAMYVLAGANRRSVNSNEASLKYFILGALASAILLFGIALYYASTASLSVLNPTIKNQELYQLSILIIMSVFAFKVALAPFHFWAPDVYQGTPTLFTTVMATLVKIAGFGAIFQFIQAQHSLLPNWIVWFFALVIVTSMLIGNIFAYNQSSVKRMLAYSSVVQAGFILMGFLNFREETSWMVLFYLSAYCLASIVTFMVTYFVEEQSGTDHIHSFAGLSKSNPILAVVMTVALISLAGVPLTAGFMSKLFVLKNANIVGLTSLVVISLILAVVSFYYYFKVINAMYSASGDQKFKIPALYQILLVCFSVALILLGIAPSLLKAVLQI